MYKIWTKNERIFMQLARKTAAGREKHIEIFEGAGCIFAICPFLLAILVWQGQSLRITKRAGDAREAPPERGAQEKMERIYMLLYKR